MNENQDSVDNAEIGRILHFVLDKYPNPNKCRPAIVVEDWPGNGRTGLVNIAVFTDGSNDGKYGVDDHTHQIPGLFRIEDATIVEKLPYKTDKANLPLMVGWETSVLPNHAVKAVRTWHWPRECKSLHEPMEVFIEEYTKERYYHNHGNDMTDIHNCVGCIAKAKFIKENIPT